MTSDAGGATETWTEPSALSVRQQKQFVRILLQGASPAVACAQLGVSLECARLTFDVDPHFRRRVEQIPQTLAENVRAALYLKALKGTVTAQTFWLKDAAAGPASQEESVPLDPKELAAELVRLRKFAAPDQPTESP